MSINLVGFTQTGTDHEHILFFPGWMVHRTVASNVLRLIGAEKYHISSAGFARFSGNPMTVKLFGESTSLGIGTSKRELNASELFHAKDHFLGTNKDFVRELFGIDPMAYSIEECPARNWEY